MDDLRASWLHGKYILKYFKTHSSLMYPNIKFTIEVEKSQLAFLDLLTNWKLRVRWGMRDILNLPTLTVYITAALHHHLFLS